MRPPAPGSHGGVARVARARHTTDPLPPTPVRCVWRCVSCVRLERLESIFFMRERGLLVPGLPMASLLASLVHVAEIEVQVHGHRRLFVFCRFTGRPITNATYAPKHLPALHIATVSVARVLVRDFEHLEIPVFVEIIRRTARAPLIAVVRRANISEVVGLRVLANEASQTLGHVTGDIATVNATHRLFLVKGSDRSGL